MTSRTIDELIERLGQIDDQLSFFKHIIKDKGIGHLNTAVQHDILTANQEFKTEKQQIEQLLVSSYEMLPLNIILEDLGSQLN